MILREPITIFLAIVLGLVVVTNHVDKVTIKKEHALKVHYLELHPNAYNAEINLRLKNRESERKASKYRVEI